MPRRRLVHFLLLGCALAFHLAGVTAVLRQPLDVGQARPEERPWTWALFNDSVHRAGPAADFFALYHAGVNVRQGAGVFRNDEEPRVTPYYFPYRYLPAVGQVLGTALAQLAPRTAWWVWVGVLEILLAGLLWRVRRSQALADVRVAAAVALLAGTPYLLEVHMGQFTFAAFALLAIAVMVAWEPGGRRESPGRWPAVASALGAAALLKLVPLVVLPLFLRRRRTALAGAVAAVLVLGSALVWFLAHPQDWQTFRNANFRPPGGLDSGNFGLVGMIHTLAGPQAVVVAFWLRPVVLGLVAAAVLAARRPLPAVCTCLLVLAHFLTYVHVWEHHMTGVMVVGVMLLLEVGTDPQGRRDRIHLALAAAALALLALPTAFALLDGVRNPAVWDPSREWSLGWRLLLPLPKVAGQFLLFAVAWLRLAAGGFALPWRRTQGFWSADS